VSHSPAIPTSVSVIILAGGQSRRMGRDKPWLELGGAPLIAHVMRRLAPLAVEFVISTNDPAAESRLAGLTALPLATAADLFPGAGPLAGLHAALSAVTTEWAFAVAADMPFVSPELVRRMMAESPGADAVVPRLTTRGGSTSETEPLHALYHARCAAPIARRLAAGDRRLVSFIPDINAVYVGDDFVQQADPRRLSFFNVNTPEEWEQAEKLLQDL
jgi:molybdenum cofactor guanylyltransferase